MLKSAKHKERNRWILEHLSFHDYGYNEQKKSFPQKVK